MDIKLGKNDKRYVEGSDDVFEIMQRILRRENKIDREKEHFWIIGMNDAVKTAKDIAKAAKNETKKERQQKEALVIALWEKEVSIEQIAIIMDTTPKIVEKIVNRKKSNVE